MKNITTAIAEQRAIVVGANVCGGNELKKKCSSWERWFADAEKKCRLHPLSFCWRFFCSFYHIVKRLKHNTRLSVMQWFGFFRFLSFSALLSFATVCDQFVSMELKFRIIANGVVRLAYIFTFHLGSHQRVQDHKTQSGWDASERELKMPKAWRAHFWNANINNTKWWLWIWQPAKSEEWLCEWSEALGKASGVEVKQSRTEKRIYMYICAASSSSV